MPSKGSSLSLAISLLILLIGSIYLLVLWCLGQLSYCINYGGQKQSI
jgi:hypothetical protein